MKFKSYKLSELVKIKYGKNQKNVEVKKSDIPILGTGGGIGYSCKAIYSKPSVLIGRKGSIDKVSYIDIPFWSVDTLFYTEVNEFIVIPHYPYYVMSLLNLSQYDEGTTIPSLRTQTLNELIFDIPPIEDQKRTLHVLECIDNKINLNNKINKNLEDQAQSVFKSWFIDTPSSSTWQTGTFSDIIDTMIAGDWGKDHQIGNNTEMVYCIRGTDIPDVKSGNKGKMPARFILPKNYATKQLVAGDVVVEISGGSPSQSTGRIASISQSLLNRYDKGMVCTNFCKAMKPKPGYSMFVYYYWQYLYDKGVFFMYENGTTGIKNLDISGFIKTELIVLPPVDLVKKFNTFCLSLFDVIFVNGHANEQLAKIRDTLLPKLMSGELDVSKLDF